MKTIELIPIEQLYHHPENPRQDLGDLTELAESIRANGVMQNLTVVSGHWMDKEEWIRIAKSEGITRESAEGTYDPATAWATDGFTVVIGNRRMEAAKIAGLAEVPCVISDMDHRTQISTMLMENMQRADLTVYEQAQGFQMMMNLGFTPREIGEKTGFSETTVNRRLKMAELDKDTFQKAVGMQITMDDLDRLGQLDSVKERNAILKEYGERNFDWKLMRAIKVQKANKVKTKARQMLKDAKAEKIPDKDRYNLYSGGYERLVKCELDKWNGKDGFIPKSEQKLFYLEDETDIDIYVKKAKKKTETVRKSQEELEEEKQIALAWKSAERASETAYELRKAFAEGLKVSPKNAMEMLQWALIATLASDIDYDSPTNVLRKEKIIEGYSTQENIAKACEWLKAQPQSMWATVIFWTFEGDAKGKKGYADGIQRNRPEHRENRKLDLEYEWLTRFGYQMSDEEIRMMSGTHECFGKEAEA